VLLTTHYLDEADKLCDRIAVIDRGRNLVEDTPDGLKRRIGNERLEIVATQPDHLPAIASLAGKAPGSGGEAGRRGAPVVARPDRRVPAAGGPPVPGPEPVAPGRCSAIRAASACIYVLYGYISSADHGVLLCHNGAFGPSESGRSGIAMKEQTVMTATSETPPVRSRPDGGDEPVTGPPPRGVDIVLAAQRRWVRHVWWVALIAGIAGTTYVWLATPHVREIESVWDLVARLLTFVFLCCAIAFFPGVSGRLHWLLYLPFIFYVAYLFPRIGYFYFVDVERVEDGSFYTHQFLLSYPGIVLTAAAAYRLGGGSPGRCLKIAVSGMLIIFSGLLDYMWWLVNPVDLPEVIDAPHITILTGGPISYGSTVLFIAAHIPIIVGINLLPLDRWLARLFRAGEPAAVR
jgi:hypothetical protein